MLSLVILILAGLLAGGLNAVAGGGTFVSYPALIWLGIPPVSANATATLTALPGYIASAWAFKKEINKESKANLFRILAICIIGGCIGALLLLNTSDKVFSGIVPHLMLFATALFAFGPKLIARIKGDGRLGLVAAAIIILIVSVYGGYFNGGLGIMLLASFTIIGYRNLHFMNGMKNLLSAILSSASAIIFIFSGLIDWHSAVILGAATAVGGVVGGHYSTRIKNTSYLRVFIMLVGLSLSVIFFIQNYF